MPKITIELTDFEMAVLAHKYPNVAEFVAKRIKSATEQYATNLADRLVKRAIAAPSKRSMPMDLESIVNLMLNEEGYLNAADRKAALDAAQPAPTPEGPFPNLIV